MTTPYGKGPSMAGAGSRFGNQPGMMMPGTGQVGMPPQAMMQGPPMAGGGGPHFGAVPPMPPQQGQPQQDTLANRLGLPPEMMTLHQLGLLPPGADKLFGPTGDMLKAKRQQDQQPATLPRMPLGSGMGMMGTNAPNPSQLFGAMQNSGGLDMDSPINSGAQGMSLIQQLLQSGLLG